MPESAPAAGPLRVEVVYALPDSQTLLSLTVPAGTTALQAVDRSGILQRHPDLVLADLSLGVFGKAVRHDTPLRDHDRVEIYRPLLGDPKEIRRRRAAEGKSMKRGQRAGGTGA